MAKAKAAPKPKPAKPAKPKKEKPVKAKATKQPKAVKPRVQKPKIKSDIYTMALLLTFFALVAACVFLYQNNAFHTANM